jgi:peptidylprolyl isomerase
MIAGCGGSSHSGGGSNPSAEARQTELSKVPGTANPPPLKVPPGPPPKELVVRDVKKGSGAEIQPHRGFTTNYLALDYGSGKAVEDYWQGVSFEWCWRTGGLTEGWEVGLDGMRVGGQRELIVPSDMAYDSGARVYVIELLSVTD